MNEPEPLRLHARIHSQYQVSDRSGRLPFSIVFGLCRRSKADTDPRPLLINTARSALDVPYALAHKLLTLHAHGSYDDSQGSIKVDLSLLTKTDGDDVGTYISLSSPVERKDSKFDAFTSYHYHVAADSELASILEPGMKYTIRFAGEDLAVEWHAYGDHDHLISPEGRPLRSSKSAALISESSHGRATFTVVSSLPGPEPVTTRMRLSRSEEASSTDSQNQQSATFLEISTTNIGTRAISVQSRGRQRFLVPWGIFHPEVPTADPRPRITDPAERSILSNLQVIDIRTSVVVRDGARPPLCGLYDTRADQRPKMADLVTLEPGEPLVRRVDIAKILIGLPDGRYSVRLQSRGAWWCAGTVEEMTDEGDVRVPHRHYKTMIPPLQLQSADVVDLRVEGGKAVVEAEGSERQQCTSVD